MNLPFILPECMSLEDSTLLECLSIGVHTGKQDAKLVQLGYYKKSIGQN